VKSFEYRGSGVARLNPTILQWLESPQLAGVIVCPSNPFISIDPILSLPTLRDALRNAAVPVIAVSPIIGGKSLKGPLAKMMAEMSLPRRASWFASHYRDFVDGLLIDSTDGALATDIEAMDVRACVTNTVMESLDDRIRLAKTSLEFADTLSQSNWAIAVSGK
jgi:LPPG:FO 2-phospho-L-lactate transferase